MRIGRSLSRADETARAGGARKNARKNTRRNKGRREKGTTRKRPGEDPGEQGPGVKKRLDQ
ncbi:hypothetical protein AU468_10855 [Alkalispirochaeta sphaeroplastigenens]|uniref:Uncharacterized protein n=1 Tax=Alkalispirochaeta sphaeroplastigenens TaxID=1187066 RepID=A0A2S4JHT0_9SPIO|nr:hypothetical protein AU468_10855 [Alkalispirochaeta sphaeroplastigenens]